MIVDTSAVLAVLFLEPDAERYERAIVDAAQSRMSTANFFEAAMVVESRTGATGGLDLDRLIERGQVRLEPVTPEQAHVARQAWRRFGRGNHPAALSYGDCFAYALAEVTQEPLLFKGNDFMLTDVAVA